MLKMVRWMLPATAALGMLVGLSVLTVRAADDAKDSKAGKGNISGTVTDKDGKAVEGVTVNLAKPRQRGSGGGGGGGPAGGGTGGDAKKDADKQAAIGQPSAERHQNRPTPIATATTDKDGKFTMNDVAVGEYMVGVRDQEKKLYGRERVTVEDGKTASVEIKCTDTPPQRGGGGGGGGGGNRGGAGGGGNGGAGGSGGSGDQSK